MQVQITRFSFKEWFKELRTSSLRIFACGSISGLVLLFFVVCITIKDVFLCKTCSLSIGKCTPKLLNYLCIWKVNCSSMQTSTLLDKHCSLSIVKTFNNTTWKLTKLDIQKWIKYCKWPSITIKLNTPRNSLSVIKHRIMFDWNYQPTLSVTFNNKARYLLHISLTQDKEMWKDPPRVIHERSSNEQCSFQTWSFLSACQQNGKLVLKERKFSVTTFW